MQVNRVAFDEQNQAIPHLALEQRSVILYHALSMDALLPATNEDSDDLPSAFGHRRAGVDMGYFDRIDVGMPCCQFH